MTEAFTEEWLADLTRRINAAMLASAVTGCVGCVVSGGPQGETAWSWDIADGQVSSARLGAVGETDLMLTATADDALAISDGSLDASVAFMQGRLKSTGDTGLLFELLVAAPHGSRGGARQTR